MKLFVQEPYFEPSGPNSNPFHLKGTVFQQQQERRYHHQSDIITTKYHPYQKVLNHASVAYGKEMDQYRSSLVPSVSPISDLGTRCLNTVIMTKSNSPLNHVSLSSQTSIFIPPISSSTSDSVRLQKEGIKTVLDKRKKKQNANINRGKWTKSEHEEFLKGYQKYGNNWKKISEEYVPTRTKIQLASHAQKYFERIALLNNAKTVEERKNLMKKCRSLFFLKEHILSECE
jgi:SHAQKYF class myb-like DNA-binding protein